MMKNRFVAMTFILTLTVVLAAPAAAAPSRSDDGAWGTGFLGLALDWLMEVLPSWPAQGRPEARVAASQGGMEGTLTPTCELCPGTQSRAEADPNG